MNVDALHFRAVLHFADDYHVPAQKTRLSLLAHWRFRHFNDAIIIVLCCLCMYVEGA